MLLLLQLASPALHRPSARSPIGAQPLLDCMHAQHQLAGPLIQKLLQVRKKDVGRFSACDIQPVIQAHSAQRSQACVSALGSQQPDPIRPTITASGVPASALALQLGAAMAGPSPPTGSSSPGIK